MRNKSIELIRNIMSIPHGIFTENLTISFQMQEKNGNMPEFNFDIF